MLGEKHSLLHDFPEHKQTINQLCQSDESFVDDNIIYNALDKEIRMLELDNDPISDDEMNRLKQARAAIKDALFQQIINAKK